MAKPLAAMARTDGVASAARDAAQGTGGPRSVLANPLLDQAPRRLDWVEVVRIGRQESQGRPARFDELAHGWRLVGAQIIQQHDIPGPESRRQARFTRGAPTPHSVSRASLAVRAAAIAPRPGKSGCGGAPTSREHPLALRRAHRSQRRRWVDPLAPCGAGSYFAHRAAPVGAATTSPRTRRADSRGRSG